MTGHVMPQLMRTYLFVVETATITTTLERKGGVGTLVHTFSCPLCVYVLLSTFHAAANCTVPHSVLLFTSRCAAYSAVMAQHSRNQHLNV